MADERTQRHLAAILASDVVGYSRLMEQDESATFERLRAHRKDLFEPVIEKHRGRIFKLMGDGLLAEFGSVVDAIECALALQRGMSERNVGIAAGERIDLRMGVHVGDVIIEGDDRLGDTVNIAARLQQLADPGGICVSGPTAEHARHKVSLRLEPRGEVKLKNIADPVVVHRVSVDASAGGKVVAPTSGRTGRRIAGIGIAVLVLAAVGGGLAWWQPWTLKQEPTTPAGTTLPLPDEPSIAVLPFINLSDDPKQEYFADGITDDLITALAQVSGLFVISSDSTFTYKGRVVPPKQISEELRVRYVLEGSVQRADQQVRINAQLIDATTGGHVWADRYEGSLADIFALQNKVTRSIADALALRLSPGDRQATGRRETTVTAAYEAFLRGWEHYRRATPDDYVKAIPYLEDAIKLDPRYGRAYAALAAIYFSTYERWWHESLGLTYAEATAKAKQFLANAQEFPTSTSHQVAGNIARHEGRSDEALAEFRAAIELDPSDSWNFAFMAETLNFAGRSAEAVPNIETAMRLDPHHPAGFLRILGTAQFQLEQFEAAAESLSNAIAISPDDQWALATLVATYGYLGQTEEAARAVTLYNAVAAKLGRLPLTIWQNDADAGSYVTFESLPIALSVPADRKRLTKGLQLAGVPAYLTSEDLGALNKLSAAELQSILFGHQLRGHDYGYRIDADRFASITANGVATFSGNWGHWRGAAATIEKDRLCIRAQFDSIFFDAYRFPGGTRAKLNEYILVNTRGAYTFSPVD